MLRGLHEATSNWLGKTVLAVLMSLLIVSFAVWGIGDIFRGFGRASLAKIGSVEISAEQFRQLYSERMQQVSQRFGRGVSAEQARALGLDQQLLAELIAQAALDDRVRRLRLGVTDAEVARRITEEPMFRGVTGRFDRFRFLQMLQNLQTNEQRYVSDQRRVLLRHQISEALSGEVRLAGAMLDVANRYQGEERTIEYIVLDRTKAGDIPAPSPETLATYFTEHKAEFRAPEFRKVVLLLVNAEEVAKTITVSDEDARRIYQDRSAKYSTPERRQVQQITFDTLEQAQAAADRVAGGLDFIALATELGKNERDVDLGLVTKSAMLDAAAADVAFSLEEGKVSAPFKGRFGFLLVRVVKVSPGSVRSFENASDEIKRELAVERAKAEIANRHDKIEDARAGGQQLAEVADKLGMRARVIDAIDREGRDANGERVPDLPQAQGLITGAFNSDIGIENDPLQLPGGGYVWFEVAGITPARDRTIDEVKDRVETRWRNDQIAERLKVKADGLVDKIKSGTSLADTAAAEELKVESASGLKRRRQSEAMSARLLDATFRTAKGEVNSAEGQSLTERVVFRVTDVMVPPLDPNSRTARSLEDTLGRSLADDILAQYIVQVQNEIGVSVNDTVLRQVIGGTGDVY